MVAHAIVHPFPVAIAFSLSVRRAFDAMVSLIVGLFVLVASLFMMSTSESCERELQ